MARLGYGHIERDNVSLHYYRTGDEKPPVILLHGLSENGLCWGRLALALEPEYDVIMMDARGHGLSDSPETGYGASDRAADVACLIETLELEHPPLIGHSMGADTAVRVASEYPNLVSSLILEDPPFWENPQEETAQCLQERSEQFKKNILNLKSKSIDELVEIGKQQHPLWDDTEFIQWAKGKQQVKPVFFLGTADVHPSWREVVHQIKCPGLLLTGDPKAGSIVTATAAGEIKSLWSKVKVVNIPEAGHSIRRDQFELYRDEVVYFLEKHKAPKKRGLFQLFKREDDLH